LLIQIWKRTRQH